MIINFKINVTAAWQEKLAPQTHTHTENKINKDDADTIRIQVFGKLSIHG